MQVNPLPLLGGLLSYTRLYRLLFPKRGGGNASRADYCYAMWLRHLDLLYQSGMSALPQSVAEFGPGASLGVGLAALLSGVREYVALDLVPHAEDSVNFAVLDELVQMFKARAPTILGAQFPRGILSDDMLAESLSSDRIAQIRRALALASPNAVDDGVSIRYVAPWTDRQATHRASFGLILSHSVLEHVDDLSSAYAYFAHSLSEDGWMSHWIDFKCHGTTSEWNGHWACGDRIWSMLRGRKPFLINRHPLSEHLRLLDENGFSAALNDRIIRVDGIGRRQLSPRFRDLGDDDLHTAGVQLISRRAGRDSEDPVA